MTSEEDVAILKTKAFVLKKSEFRETSLIVRFFSKEFGKISCLFKGIRETPEKFASSLEPFSLNEVIFYKSNKNDLHIASQCDLLDNYDLLRSNLNKVSVASSMLSLIDSLIQEEQESISTFMLLKDCLTVLTREQDGQKLLFIFKIKILSLSGFKPHIDSCVGCNCQISYSDKAYFSSAQGGLLCGKCLKLDKAARLTYRGTIATLKFIQNNGLNSNLRLGLNSLVRKELLSLLNTFLEFHLEKRLKTLSYT